MSSIFLSDNIWMHFAHYGYCCTHWRKKQMFGDFQDVFRDVTLMANSFNLRRGGLSMCPGDTVLWRAADESRPERSQASPFICEKQAS